MKVKEIKAELTQLGASTVGLLEKSEFVEALLAAREAAAEREANAEPEPVYDADVNEGQTQKMPKVRAQSNPSSPAQSNSLAPTLAPRLTRTSPTPNPTLITLKLTLTRRASSRAAEAACPVGWVGWAARAACQAAWAACPAACPGCRRRTTTARALLRRSRRVRPSRRWTEREERAPRPAAAYLAAGARCGS